MNFNAIFQEVVNFAGTFNLYLILAIYLMLIVGEFSISIPYLLETIWILTGYHAVTGIITPPQVIALMAVAMSGRETGAVIFYNLTRYGSVGVMRLYRRYFRAASDETTGSKQDSLLNKALRRTNLLSPFSVAFGRLFYLKVPLTITLGLKRKWSILLPAVAIHSFIWDSIYILIGVVGGNAQLSTLRLLLYSLGGITVIYGVTFIIRRLSRLLPSKR